MMGAVEIFHQQCAGAREPQSGWRGAERLWSLRKRENQSLQGPRRWSGRFHRGFAYGNSELDGSPCSMASRLADRLMSPRGHRVRLARFSCTETGLDAPLLQSRAAKNDRQLGSKKHAMTMTPMMPCPPATTQPDGIAFMPTMTSRGLIMTCSPALSGCHAHSWPWRSAGETGLCRHAELARMAIARYVVFASEADRVPDEPSLQDRRTARGLPALQPALILGEEQLYSSRRNHRAGRSSQESVRHRAGRRLEARRCPAAWSSTAAPGVAAEPDKDAPAALGLTCPEPSVPPRVRHPYADDADPRRRESAFADTDPNST